MFKAHRYVSTTLIAVAAGVVFSACASYGPAHPRLARYPYPAVAYRSPAIDIGYRDGFEVGRDDSRHRESYNPVRSRYYRAADHEYDRRDGPRDAYTREYRAAFERGYAEGFQQWRRGWRRSGSPRHSDPRALQ